MNQLNINNKEKNLGDQTQISSHKKEETIRHHKKIKLNSKIISNSIVQAHHDYLLRIK